MTTYAYVLIPGFTGLGFGALYGIINMIKKS